MHNKILIAFDILIFFLSIMNFLLAPLAINFSGNPEAIFEDKCYKSYLVYIPLILFLIKDVISLNVGYINKFTLIVDRKLILKNTLKTQFAFEILTIFFEIIGTSINS